jgi:hypothetical protein
LLGDWQSILRIRKNWGFLMAGDWLKLEISTPEKAEVLAITAHMGWDDPDTTVGKLFRLWRWFDQQTIDGNAPSVTPALLDRIVGVSGFINAMQKVAWIIVTDDGISLPNFDRHNGQTAKDRALTAKRVAKHKGNAKPNATGNAGTVSGSLPREEKRREEKSNSVPEGTDAGGGSFDPEDGPPEKSQEDLAKADLWKAAVSVLENGGCPKAQCRTFMGKLVKDYGIEIVTVAVAAAVSAQPADAKEYLKAACQHGSGQRSHPNKQETLEQNNRKVASDWASQGDPNAEQ